MDDIQTTLQQKINANFATALEKVVPDIVCMLTEKRSNNEQSDTGDQSTQLTIQPKIKIEFGRPADFAIKVQIPVKSIRTKTGESEEEFSLNAEQQELPMGADNKAVAAKPAEE